MKKKNELEETASSVVAEVAQSPKPVRKNRLKSEEGPKVEALPSEDDLIQTVEKQLLALRKEEETYRNRLMEVEAKIEALKQERKNLKRSSKAFAKTQGKAILKLEKKLMSLLKVQKTK
ncbi:MAG: hypothetical protein HC913_10375 [Microscillaceae bacterium]|nr:hypothetical protein [Microscillaceae bacterium]